MRVVLLGTEGYHPTDRGHTAAVFLPEVGVLLDAGTGVYRLGRYLVTPSLDIFLTHAHLDHVVGLTYLLGVLHGREVQVRVHAEPHVLEAVEQHLFATPLFPVAPRFASCPLSEQVALAAGGRLQAFAVPGHPGGSVGFRLDWPGHSLAYVTDAVAAEDAPYVESIRNARLLLHECNFPDAAASIAEATGHSHTSRVAAVAKAAAVERLVLTHVDPFLQGADPIELAAARRIFTNCELGHDLMELEF